MQETLFDTQKTNTAVRVAELKEADQDFEWYPTTPAIINKVSEYIRGWVRGQRGCGRDEVSVLDIGAGDGRVLNAIKDELHDPEWHRSISVNRFAIEKAVPHLADMPKQISVVGTDFHEQTLVDKRMDAVFCNPPYSEFKPWMIRIIREVHASMIFLVVPARWNDDDEIRRALEYRGIEVVKHSPSSDDEDYFTKASLQVMGDFDFENAERQARCKVQLLLIRFRTDKNSTFDAAIEEMLPELKSFEAKLEADQGDDPVGAITTNEGLIDNLLDGYQKELARLYDAYAQVARIRPSILKELGITKEAIIGGLRSKITGLKDKYWQALFDFLGDIKKRMATKQRTAFLESLIGKGHIDFTKTNIDAILIWIIRHSCDNFDEQLIELYQKLAQKGNVERYKSNEKVFKWGHWRYLAEGESHYKLCYRLVLEHCGRIYDGNWAYEGPNGLTKEGHEFIADYITVANNLGFDCDDSTSNYQWKSGTRHTIKLRNGEPLMDVKFFKNGNCHMFPSKDFMLALNVQAGKLLGWLRSAAEAMDELKVDEADAEIVAEKFDLTYKLTPSNVLRIESKSNA